MPWWTSELTILRKRTLALRRYKRTRNDDNLRQERMLQYQEGKRHYQAKLQEGKLRSSKEFCSQSADSNPWKNALYKLASRKLQSKTTLSTLKIQNGTYTSDIVSTMKHMMGHFIPEDTERSDSAHHTYTRHLTAELIDALDDVEFTREEILAVLEKFDPSKAPGEEGLNRDTCLKTFKRFPTFFTEIYNEFVRKGHFPKQWNHSIIIPIVKPGKEGSTDVNKYRPISLLNIGGKVLENLLIDRINHHVFSNCLINENQC